MMTINQTNQSVPIITNANELFQKLRRSEKKDAKLYLFCNFVSLLLITAYAAMMYSPTVLLVFPKGGDSRKQMTAIFVLALLGCVIFTIYAASLFFRKKSKQLGTLMALGAPRRWIAPGLYQEVLLLSGVSSLLGIVAAFPFLWLIWSTFRLFVVDSAEMKLDLDYHCLGIAAMFLVIVIAFSCLTARRYLNRANIMDVLHEVHKNEPVRPLGRFSGPAGIILLFGGAILGYAMPTIYCKAFQIYYPPIWLNLFYAPVFVGLYMIMLHTVVHGWHSYQRNPYKNIIARSMMKFQGKQTVNNLLVSTLLIAGASFALFYTPMMSIPQLLSFSSRPYNYFFLSPQNISILEEDKTAALMEEYDLSISQKQDCPNLVLGMDGYLEVEKENNKYDVEYRSLLAEGRFLSASALSDLIGSPITVDAGTYCQISNDNETSVFWGNQEATLLTNMAAKSTLPVTFAGCIHFEMLAGSIPFYVLNDDDYEAIKAGITPEWTEHITAFQTGETDSYDFANKLFRSYISSFGDSEATPYYYDRVTKYSENERDEIYWGDTDSMTKLSFEYPDSTEFRNYWLYMPKIKIMDQTDFVRTYAVFLMMFSFIAIICLLAAIVICYVRCMTITLNNRYVFDDLKKLGAAPAFLGNEVKSEAKNVFRIPALVGMGAMFLLYILLMYGNDGVLTSDEIISLSVCFVLLLALGLLLYLVYRFTLKSMKKQLDIPQ